MKKIIEIPDDIIIELKVLAAQSNLPLKNYIEKELQDKVEKSRKKVSNPKTK